MTKGQKRFLIICSRSESLINFRLNLIKKLLESGYEVSAIGNVDHAAKEQLLGLGVPLHEINVNRHSLSVFSNITYFIQLLKAIKKIKPEHTLAYTAKSVIYGTIAAAIAKVKYRHMLISGLGYAYTAKTLKSKIIRIITNVLYKISANLAASVIFQNDDDLELFCSAGICKRSKSSKVNGSGVDLNYYSSAPYPKEVSFLMIARLLPEKGVNEYISACRKLKLEYPEVKCRLAGFIDSPHSDIGQRELDEWQREGVIEFLGQFDDVRPLMKDCSVYVLPSYREGTPRSSLEAMAMGRPLITTNAVGCRETVEDGVNGFVTSVGSSETIYEKMRYFIEQPKAVEVMGKESRFFAEKHFDVNKVNNQMFRAMNLR